MMYVEFVSLHCCISESIFFSWIFYIRLIIRWQVLAVKLAARLSCVGEFFNAPLGNVYAEDEDDWDVENKTFAFVNSEQERYFKYHCRTFLLILEPVVVVSFHK